MGSDWKTLKIFDSLVNDTIGTAKVVRRIVFNDINECAPLCIERFVHILPIDLTGKLRKKEQKCGRVSQNRNSSSLTRFMSAYVLNTGPFSMLANANPTILPSVNPHMMSKPSDEIVKQSISDGNAMTFVLWLRPLIKSFSNRCNILSMATTTCSLRYVARNLGSWSI